MIASTMILTGSILILALAGYWMRRAVKAERHIRSLSSAFNSMVEAYELSAAELNAWNDDLIRSASTAEIRLDRIISLETKSMAHVGKVAVAIAKGRR